MDSNHRPTDYESAALTAVLRALQRFAVYAAELVSDIVPLRSVAFESGAEGRSFCGCPLDMAVGL